MVNKKSWSAQQKELLRQQQAASTGSTHTCRPESLKTEISKYKVTEEDSLLRWFVEFDDAIRACHIVDEQMQVAFLNRTRQDVQDLGLGPQATRPIYLWVVRSL